MHVCIRLQTHSTYRLLSNEMSFWENEDELYPDTADFDRFTADPTSGDPVDQGDIRGKR